MPEWYEVVDVKRIDVEARRRLLEYAVDRYGKRRVMEQLGVSRVTLYRLLRGDTSFTDEYVRRLLPLLQREEFEEVVGKTKTLELIGITRGNGVIDYSLLTQILALASKDEYARQLIIRFVVDSFREDVKKALGIISSDIVLKWTKDFEEFLKRRKRRRKIRREDTLNYYRKLFIENLEGRKLTHELVDEVVSHPNPWLRNIFRHYVQYLYFKRRISGEMFGWIMEAVPSRTYKSEVRVFHVNPRRLVETMRFLAEHHELYHLIYEVMYYSGIRLEHAVILLHEYRPDEIVEVPGVDLVTQRLVCFEDAGFCRYYMGLRGTHKPCEWVWLPVNVVKRLEEHAGTKVTRHKVSDYARNHNLLRPSAMRKINWQILIKTIPDKDTARFIQSRLGEIPVSEARYGDLLTSADTHYPTAMTALQHSLQDPEYMEKLLLGQEIRNKNETR